jgi:hypothetical protein
MSLLSLTTFQEEPKELNTPAYSHTTTRRSSTKSWPWYQIGVPKAIALSHLEGLPDGAFIVRSSESRNYWFDDCYLLYSLTSAALL